MDDADFDLLCEELPPVEAKRLRKMLVQWCDGDENSFPVQLALLTRAQWHAAAQTPLVLRGSLELLDRKLGEYRQHTGTLIKNFESSCNTKVKELQTVIGDHKHTAENVLADLQASSANAKALLRNIQEELTKGTAELKQFRDEFATERHRLAEERLRLEQQKNWWDWITLGLLLLAAVIIGIQIGWRWH